MLIKSAGVLCAHLPESILANFAKAVGFLLVAIPWSRRRTLLANLNRAFPKWPRKRLLTVARESAACLVEMGLFSLAYPCLSNDRIRRLLHISSKTEASLENLRRSGKPVVFFVPHVALFENLVSSPHFRPGGSRRLGAVYRPNSNPVIDDWILASRLRCNLKMFARRTALIDAKSHLRRNNWLAILFDQNAGSNGTLITFINRLASATALPGIMATGTKAIPVFASPKRKGFFRATLNLTIMKAKSSTELITESHELLENHFRYSDQACAEWLWVHGRWKTQDFPEYHLRLKSKRISLPPYASLPKKTKIWIRLPNWLGDVVMTLPLLKALPHARPDAEITLICHPQFHSLLEILQVGDSILPLPRKGGLGYYRQIFKLRHEYPDLQILFTNSLRGDIEARLIGAPRRYGILRFDKPRPLLTNIYKATKDDLASHQTCLWERFLQNFGLQEKANFTPFSLPNTEPSDTRKIVVAIAPGSSNTPAKRWSCQKWQSFVEKLLKADEKIEVHFFGSSAEKTTAQAIITSLPTKRIRDRTGKTDLAGFARELVCCNLFVGNVSGGMHLANALGVPVLALFGPTDSAVTGPAFKAPRTILRPRRTRNIQFEEMHAFDSEEVTKAALEMLI